MENGIKLVEFILSQLGFLVSILVIVVAGCFRKSEFIIIGLILLVLTFFTALGFWL
ncbi:hypothetical protein [Lactococcus lactis]|uniref:hypothetical protein n=1 Tax=Lactococcus lactis TaxID=1358 RepID=UPI0013A5A0FC|nr:hypothetical protein [Lactococcus lactis]